MKIKINNNQYTFKLGETLINVADRNNIHIPRFCYHDKLSIAANCRMCLIEKKGISKALPACSTIVNEDEEYFTKSNIAVSAQKNTLEFLLINHPLDCPVCDQGGMCELQDLSMEHGSLKSRYNFEKRVVVDYQIGSLIKTNMTRCIHCTRCVRFGEEIAGLKEFGAVGRGESMEIRTYVSSAIKSPMSGNMIDICPVGALNASPSHMKGRAWELEEIKSIASNDCVGSNIYSHVYNNEIFRITPSQNEEINETWLSDRDRFYYEGNYHKERLKNPLVKIKGRYEEVEWQKAFDVISENIKYIDKDSMAGFVSADSTVEEQFLFQKILRDSGVKNIDHRVFQDDFRLEELNSSYPRISVPISEIPTRDTILLIDSDLSNNQPIISHKIRQAKLNNSNILSIHSYKYDYNFDLDVSCLVTADNMVDMLCFVYEEILKENKVDVSPNKKILELIKNKNIDKPESIKNIAKNLILSNSPMIILGSNIVCHPDYQVIKFLSFSISELLGIEPSILTNHCNTSGAWIADCVPYTRDNDHNLKNVGLNVKESLSSKLKFYIFYNLEIADFYHYEELKDALKSSKFTLGVQSYLDRDDIDLYDVILPLSTSFENSGTYINAEGRWQSFIKTCEPFYESKEGWKILLKLSSIFGKKKYSYKSSQDILEEINNRSRKNIISSYKIPKNVSLSKNLSDKQLCRFGYKHPYTVNSILRRSDALNKSVSKDIVVRINKNTLKSNGIELDKNKIILKQSDKSFLTYYEIDENVPNNFIYIIDSEKEHQLLGKSYEGIIIENV